MYEETLTCRDSRDIVYSNYGLNAGRPDTARELIGHVESLAFQESDVAVRIRRPTEAALVTRHVGDLYIGLYATAQLLTQIGAPRNVSELSHCPLIGPDRNLAEVAFLGRHGFLCTTEQAVIRTDNHLAQFAALRAGLGVGECSMRWRSH